VGNIEASSKLRGPAVLLIYLQQPIILRASTEAASSYGTEVLDAALYGSNMQNGWSSTRSVAFYRYRGDFLHGEFYVATGIASSLTGERVRPKDTSCLK
jgi:hypothetical protein